MQQIALTVAVSTEESTLAECSVRWTSVLAGLFVNLTQARTPREKKLLQAIGAALLMDDGCGVSTVGGVTPFSP